MLHLVQRLAFKELNTSEDKPHLCLLCRKPHFCIPYAANILVGDIVQPSEPGIPACAYIYLKLNNLYPPIKGPFYDPQPHPPFFSKKVEIFIQVEAFRYI